MTTIFTSASPRRRFAQGVHPQGSEARRRNASLMHSRPGIDDSLRGETKVTHSAAHYRGEGFVGPNVPSGAADARCPLQPGGEGAVSDCPWTWCDAPWSSGRTRCPGQEARR
jgi:hypothetical protein